jgi:sugar (glycoside-pentoside-hexuronide) transporter
MAVDTEAQPVPLEATGDRPQDLAQEKMKFWEKFSYGLTSFSTLPIGTLLSTFLLIFYTDVVGLNPIAVGTLFVVARLFDGINDPITGFLIDRLPRWKMGKFRILLMGGSVICCLNFMLIWFGPVWATSGKLFIAYVTYLLHGILYDFMEISRASLMPSMTANQKDRQALGVIGAFVATFGGMVVSAVIPGIIDAGGANFHSYSNLILVAVGFSVFFAITGGLGVKQRVKPLQEANSISFKDYLKIFSHRPFLVLMLFIVLYSIGISIAGGVNAHFYTYVMNDLSMLSTVYLSMLIGLLPGIFLSGWMSRKIGKKRVLILAAVGNAVSLVLRWPDPRSVFLIYAVTIISGFMFGLFAPLANVMGADVIDYIEYKQNYRSEPAVQSLWAFASKLAVSLAGAIPAFMLGWSGYLPKATQQPDSVINAIMFTSVGVPVVFYAITAVMFAFGYNLDDKMVKTVQDTLSERRAVSNGFAMRINE